MFYLVPCESDRYLIAALLNRVIETECLQQTPQTIHVLRDLIDISNRIFVEGTFTNYCSSYEQYGIEISNAFSCIELIRDKINVPKIISILGHAFLQAIESIGGSLNGTNAPTDFINSFRSATGILLMMIRTNLISQVSLNEIGKGQHYTSELRRLLETHNQVLYDIAKMQENDSTTAIIAYTRLRLMTQVLGDIVLW